MPNTIAPTDFTMEDLKIKFNSETHQIDSNTLINSLLHFTNITQEVNKELGTNKRIEIKINALKEGSFLVHLFIEASIFETVSNLFTNDNINIAKDIAFVVGGIYKIAKFLKGKPPKVIESIDASTKIENNTGDITVIDNRVFNIFQNNTSVRESITKEFETLDNDSSVTGFELLDKDDQPIVQIPKENFSDISNTEEILDATQEKILTKTGIINIASLSFEPNTKWSFYYEGNPFKAKIKDEEFAKLIDRGEKFAKGDSLEVEFEITQEFYEPANTYINKTYKIIRIIRHIPRPEQSRLDLL